MKVWRGFTLTLWVVLLAVSAAFILLYHALSTTALQKERARELFVQSKTYETIRDTVLVDHVMTAVTRQYPDNRLVEREMIKDILADILPVSTLEKRLDPAVTNIYRWLDSKEEDIAFTIPIIDKKDAFYRGLETKVSETLTSLDSCGDYRYPPEEAILEDLCLPLYVTSKEATQATMGSIRAGDFPLGESITQDTLLGDKTQRGKFNELPTYLNILWALNLLAIATFIITTVFILVSRKSHGVIALGAGLGLAGIATLASLTVVKTLLAAIPETAPLPRALSSALAPAFLTSSTWYALGSLGLGVLMIGGALVWRWRRSKHA